MKRTIAYHREVCIWIAVGVTALVVHAGCFNSAGLSSDASAVRDDSGKADGKVAALDGNAGKETRADLGTIDSPGTGTGGVVTGGASGAGGTGGRGTGGIPTGGSTETGGTTNTGPTPGDGAVIDAPQPPPLGGSGGSAGSGGGGNGGNGGGGSGGSGGASTQPPPGGTVRDGAVDRPPDSPIDAPACTASACPGPTSGSGTAVCVNGSCSITCNNGYHRCGNTCALNTNPATCGTGPNSCSPCPAGPSGASPTCSGNPLACGFACNPGYHSCGSTCVVNGSTDPNSCGNNCTVCQAPNHGTVTCNGTSCVSSCNPGYHQCGSLCLSNSSSDSCGTRCTACPTTAHGQPNCTGSNPTCGIYCDTNYHQCDNKCIINSDATNCGPNCSACPLDDNGTAICTGGTCGITCKNGWHWCNNVKKCVDSSLPATCGANCTPCTAGPGYVATCSPTTLTCGQKLAPCGPGKHACGFPPACVDENADSCGDGCIGCPGGGTTVPNSSPVCSNGACGFVCNSTYHNCPAGTNPPNCVLNNALSCGNGCVHCAVPSGTGHANCNNGTTCVVVCDDGSHQCGTASSPTCIDDSSTSTDHCGTECDPCPTPSSPPTVAACSGSPPECGFACDDSSYHLCGDSCYLNTDPSNCGTGDGTCVACTGGDVCADGQCTAAPPPPPPDAAASDAL